MPTPDGDSLPDVAIGHHPDYGIVAANPQQLPASAWMLNRLEFQPVPGHPTLYALADQGRDGVDRTTRAVDLLRRSGYRVDADAAFEPPPTPPRDPPLRRGPDIATVDRDRDMLTATTVAMQPQLAQQAVARSVPAAPSARTAQDRGRAVTPRSPYVSSAALAPSPAVARHPAKAFTSVAATGGSAARPVDPRIAFSRNR